MFPPSQLCISPEEIRSLTVHCKHSKYDVYIGRPSQGAPKSAINETNWGNPFVMKNRSYAERRRCTEEYRKYLYSNPELIDKARKELKGKVLACWCSPKDCHGHVLAEVANSTGDVPFIHQTVSPTIAAALPTVDSAKQAGGSGGGLDNHEVHSSVIQNPTAPPQPTRTSICLSAEEIRSFVVHCKTTDKYDVYIGRPSQGAPKSAVNETNWGNPFVMKNQSYAERRRCTEEYRKYLYSNPELIDKARKELKGKVLACWCSPKDCHGHVLAQVANSTGDVTLLQSTSQVVSRNSKEISSQQQPLGVSKKVITGVASAGTAADGGGEAELKKTKSRRNNKTKKDADQCNEEKTAKEEENAQPPIQLVVSDISGSKSVSLPCFAPNSLIDIGVNLTSGSFSKDQKLVVERAAKAGVSPLIITGLNVAGSVKASHLCETICSNNNKQVDEGSDLSLYFTVGIHPHEAKTWDRSNNSKMIQTISNIAKHPKCCAMGECGLDFNRNYSSKNDQILCFQQQLQIACDLNLPLFLHERDAHDDFIQCLMPFIKNHTLPLAVVHCFTGTLEEAKEYLSLGFYIGLSGYICMEKRGMRFRKEVLPYLPIDRILLETDAPFMHPTKHRSRCEPSNTVDVCCTVAEVLQMSPIAVAEQTTFNSKKLFRLA